MPHEDQGNTRATARRHFQNRPPENAYGIVRYSTLWLKPALVGHFDFLEWSGNHLRHPHFVAFRDDKHPKEVMKEN